MRTAMWLGLLLLGAALPAQDFVANQLVVYSQSGVPLARCKIKPGDELEHCRLHNGATLTDVLQVLYNKELRSHE
jgi:hypothetical protein